MCDIVIAAPEATTSRIMVFGKNSDRDPNEAQVLEYIPRMRHEEEYVELTYGRFPQVRETYAVLLSRPWWTYGAEMGVNEHGVVIGNVAVFTREPYRDKGIIGMDMLRLALERTRTAREALELLIGLTEEPGQGGNHSYGKKFRYHNSYIIADPYEAWLLETAGIYWAAKKIRDVYSISNALTINDEWDMAHPELIRHGVEKHGCSRDGFSFAKCYSDKLYTWAAHGRERRNYTYTRLREKTGELGIGDFIQILRSHSREPYHPARGSMKDICMHYGGPLRPSQTAASLIVALRPGQKPFILATITSNPCLAIYKPIPFGTPIPIDMESTTNKYNPHNYWWKHEALHRKLQTCYHIQTTQKYIKEARSIEKKLLEPVITAYEEGKYREEEIRGTLATLLELEEQLHRKTSTIINRRYCWKHPLYTLIIKHTNKVARI